MSADKSKKLTDLTVTLAERKGVLQENVIKNKKVYIKSQASIGLLHFLAEARQQLNAAENRMLAQLDNQRPSFLDFLFRKKSAPLDTSEQLSAEFETARQLLSEVNHTIVRNADETNLVERASRQLQCFEADLKWLKSGCRIEKYWNKTDDANLAAEEIHEREALGRITKTKIFRILDEVCDELHLYPIRVQEFLKTTQERVNEYVEKHVDMAYTEFAKSPLGKYLINWIELQNQTDKLLAEGKPQHMIDKQLQKIRVTTQTCKQHLADVDLQTAEDFEKHGFYPQNRLDVLVVVLPDESYQQLIHGINDSIHMKDKSA